MADETPDEPENIDEEKDGEGEETKQSKKKLYAIIALILLLLMGGGVGAWLMGVFDSILDTGEEQVDMGANEDDEAKASERFFMDVPEMLVNLNTQGSHSAYLKISVSIEVKDEASLQSIKPLLPRVMDRFQVFLRELRVSDLQGSAGVYRLREELKKRVSIAVAPVEINDVLFRDLLVQ